MMAPGKIYVIYMNTCLPQLSFIYYIIVARKTIANKWMKSNPPRTDQWFTKVKNDSPATTKTTCFLRGWSLVIVYLS